MVDVRRVLFGSRHEIVKPANCVRLAAQMIHKEVGGYCQNSDSDAGREQNNERGFGGTAHGSGHPSMGAYAEHHVQQVSSHPGVTQWSADGKVTAFTPVYPSTPILVPGVQPSPGESSGVGQQSHAGATGEAGGRGAGQWTTAMHPVAGGPVAGRAEVDEAGGGYGGVQPSMRMHGGYAEPVASTKMTKQQFRFWQSDEEQAMASAVAGVPSAEQMSFPGGPVPGRGEGPPGCQGVNFMHSHMSAQFGGVPPQAGGSQAPQAPQVYPHERVQAGFGGVVSQAPQQQGQAEFRAPVVGGSHDGHETSMGPRPVAQGQQWPAGVLRHGHQQGRAGSMPRGQHEGTAQSHHVPMEGRDGPVCKHKEPSIACVCKSEGPDKGRQFYACKLNPPCDYFQWADEPQQPDPEEATEEVREGPPADLQAAPSCYCPQQTSTVQCRNNKEHHGRWFFACTKGKTSGCGYFAWADEKLKPVGPRCRCGLMSRWAMVKRDGPNTGRGFFSCSKEKGKGCDYFQWDEQQSVQQVSTGGVATPLRGNRGGGGGGGGGGIGGGVGGHGVYGEDQGPVPAHEGGMGYGRSRPY